VQANRTIPNNRPDIIIRDNKKGTYLLIDITISGDRNVIKKEAERILKYKDLTKETGHVKCKNKVIPVIMGANRAISKPFRQYLGSIPGKHDIEELHKTDTVHIFRKVLMKKHKTLKIGNNITCTIH
jgi:hypothetical protein